MSNTNLVLESLFLRRPRIEYVSPPVCPVQPSSASASSFTLLGLPEVCGPVAPVLRLGQNNFLVWIPLPDACEGGCQNSGAGGTQTDCKSVELCYSIYRASDTNNPSGSYDLIQACIPRLTTLMCSPGCYEAAAVDIHGLEIARSAPVCGDGSGPIFIPMPVVPGAVDYNLYKTADFRNPSGAYQLVLSMFGGEAFEACVTGCYRVGFITPDGATPLSNPQCVTIVCPPLVCPEGQIWNAASCACVPIICPEQPCSPGFIWDFVNCDCVPCPVQPCLPTQIWDPTECACVPCPAQPCPPNYAWDTTTCSCQLLPGPDWNSSIGNTITAAWAIRQGNSDGVFPPVWGAPGGFLGDAFQFDGTVFQLSAERPQNFATADGQATYVYHGPPANCQVAVSTSFSGPGAGTGFGLTRGSIAGPGIISTSPTIGGVQVSPDVSGNYVAVFTLNDGDVLVLGIKNTASGEGDHQAEVSFTFTNIP